MLSNLDYFGQGIKRRREELKLSQEGLAVKAGLHRTYISGIERGKRNISLDNLVRIIHALDITVTMFFQEYAYDIDRLLSSDNVKFP